MFNDNSESHAAKLFTDYRSENNYLLTKFKNILKYVEKLEKEESVEKKEVVGSPLLNWNSDLSGLYDGLNLNINRIKEIVNKLVECLEKEKKELDSYVSKLKQSTITSQTHLEQLLISYNNEQYDYMQQLNTLIPGIIEEFDKAIGMEDETAKTTSQKIKESYENLEKALYKKIPKENLYEIVEDTLFKYKEYEKYLSEVKNHLPQNSNVIKFINNYKTNKGKTFVNKLNEYIKKIGRDKDKNISYSQAEVKESGLGEKLDKFMKSTLKQLFDDIKIGEDEKDPKRLIQDIIKVEDDMQELKDAYKTLHKKLQDTINESGLDFNILSAKKGINSMTIIDDNGNKIPLKDLNFKDEDKKDSITFVLRTLEKALEGNKPWKDNKAFKNIIRENSDLFKNAEEIIKGKKSTTDSSDNGEKIINTAHEQVENCLNNAFLDNIDEWNSENLNFNECTKLLKILVGKEKSEEDISDTLNSVMETRKENYQIDEDDYKDFYKHAKQFFDDSSLQNNVEFWKTFFKKLKKILPHIFS